VTVSMFSPDAGNSMFLQKYGICIQIHMALQPTTLTPTPLSEPQLPQSHIWFLILCQ
jgi:hypothetical protein